MMSNYLQILTDSLEQKIELLTQIESKSKEQAEMLQGEDVDMLSVDLNMDEKTDLINKVIALDEGFDTLYEKIREELIPRKEEFKEQIRVIQDLITKVTGKSASIQAIESRNKAAIESYFSKQKRGFQSRRNAMSVARDYYQNMNKVKNVSPQFLDKKK